MAVAHRPIASSSGVQSGVQSQITYVDAAPRRMSTDDGTVVLHQIRYQAPGGSLSIHWYDSDFESTAPRVIAQVSLLIDGRRVDSATKTSYTGTDEDGQGELAWRGSLSRGTHNVEVQLSLGESNWGLPYIDAGLQGVDELLIEPGIRCDGC